jgi:hypothetical protein
MQSSFIYLLDLTPDDCATSSSLAPEPVERAKKRRRLSPDSSLQNILNDIVNYRTVSLISLQILAFYLNSFRPLLPFVDISEILRQLTDILDDPNPDIVGWSLVCLLTILGWMSDDSQANSKSNYWMKVLTACLKHAAIPSTCRPACAVMDMIIKKEVLHTRIILTHIKSVLDFVEQRGPALLVDNSYDFWCSLVYKLEDVGASTDRSTREPIMRWIQFHWDVRGIADDPLRIRRLSTITFPCLRMFSPGKWTSGSLVDFKYTESLPLLTIGEALCRIFANMSLVNLLLDSHIESTEEVKRRSQHVSTPDVMKKDGFLDVFVDKQREVFFEMKTLSERKGFIDSAKVSAEELSWLTSLSLLALILLRK